jgi:hypothetical protein
MHKQNMHKSNDRAPLMSSVSTPAGHYMKTHAVKIVVVLVLMLLCAVNLHQDFTLLRYAPSYEYGLKGGASELTTNIELNFTAELSVPNMPTDVPSMVLPHFQVTSHGGSFDGFNLFVLEITNRTDGRVASRLLVICNMAGEVVLERPLGTGYSISEFPAELISPTIALMGASNGYWYEAALLNISDNSVTRLGFWGHHDYVYNHRNNTVFTFQSYVLAASGSLYLYDMIREFNLTGHEVWSYDTRTLMPPDQWSPADLFDMTWPVYDVTHSNSICYDSEQDVLYYNSRNLNTFYKINHTSGEVIWGLGDYGNFTLYNRWGQERDALFYHAHSVQEVDDNTFILFDNDAFNHTDAGNERSRIVEITVNETAMTACESWSWTAPHEYYSVFYGDADRLPNGNRLGVFGTPNHPDSDMGARIVELNAAGSIVWEMDFPDSKDFGYAVYRAERFRYQPTVDASALNVRALTHENVTVSWGISYDFRPKHIVTGAHTLYLDGNPIENGTSSFDRFWQTSHLVFNLGQMETGDHNLTLLIRDEDGHATTRSVTVQVQDFYVDREGPESFEIGQEKHMIAWTGRTCSVLTANISIDAVLHDSFNWSGSNVSLDLLTLTIGNHSIRLELFNGSTSVYDDAMVVAVYASQPPVFLAVPPLTPTPWNTSAMVSWTFEDQSPAYWRLYINSSNEETGLWGCTTYTLNWSVPREGSYNLTLEVFDSAGHMSSCSSWIVFTPPSPPIFTLTPGNRTMIWGTESFALLWEVHGGRSWSIWRNGTVISEGDSHNGAIGVIIDDWRLSGWRPGIHNLTALVTDSESSSRSTVWVRTIIDLGDLYADSVVTSQSVWVSYPDNALGSPDGQYATIFRDYGNGYLTLDMGEHEEILDGNNSDFSVVAQGGNYSVWAGNSLGKPLTWLGYGSGVQSFDLSVVGIHIARFVRVGYYAGSSTELDAIVALNYNTPVGDREAPVITPLADRWMWYNQTPMNLTWVAHDATPWSYSIFVNGSSTESGFWDGSEITFLFRPSAIAVWNVTLVLTDAFDNSARDVVLLVVRSQQTATGPGAMDLYLILAVSSFALVGSASLLYVFNMRRKRNE